MMGGGPPPWGGSPTMPLMPCWRSGPVYAYVVQWTNQPASPLLRDRYREPMGT
jgi:hypothetical protein